jgi:Fe-S-cluster containining protein
MASERVERPVWRKFHTRFSDRAAHWVKSGGHAVVYADDGRMWMVVGVDRRRKLTELALWSLLAVEQQTAPIVKHGPFEGLRRARVEPHAEWAVLDWCDRDSGFEHPTRILELDCLECAACCHDASVVLDDDDLKRFRNAGRADLTTSRYVRRRADGRVHLRFLREGRCQHLGVDYRCAIYAIRPFNCSAFPVGSEACLAAREATRSIRDEAPEARTS